MIGHDGPCMETVEEPFGLALNENLCDFIGDRGNGQPFGTVPGPVQFPVECYELVTGL